MLSTLLKYSNVGILADANFSIKCGDRQMNSDGIVFEAENRILGAARFNVTSTQKWAISNVGLFAERQNQQYVQSTLAQVRSTNTPELYRTSRLSPGSLRYYGLGLENGPYTVNLFFAETGFPGRSTESWKSLARRVFDVYIQVIFYFKVEISMSVGSALVGMI